MAGTGAKVTFAGQIEVAGPVKPLVAIGGYWIDLLGPVSTAKVGAHIPDLVALSPPHDHFELPRWKLGDHASIYGHVPHGIDPAAGVYLHAHLYVDGPSVGMIALQWEYCYAHGYGRQTLSGPLTVTAAQAATGTAKTHQIIEIASPVLVGEVEPDGILYAVCTRVSAAPDADVTDDVFLSFIDAHVRLTTIGNTSRAFPFEP